MLQRAAIIQLINVDIASFATTIQLGDSCVIDGFSRALAVQREVETFYGNEGNFSSYPVFSEPIPLPSIDENLTYFAHHINPVIKVNNIGIIGISSSSVLHVGNSRNVSMEVRVKHIRQISPKENEVNRE
jgi:spore germination protein PE